MDSVQVLAVLLGLVAGLAIIPVYEGVHKWFVRTWNPAGSTLQLIVVALMATLAACLAAGAVILVPGYLLGVMPLRANTPYFIWSFLAGGVVMRIFIERRKRRKKAYL